MKPTNRAKPQMLQPIDKAIKMAHDGLRDVVASINKIHKVSTTNEDKNGKNLEYICDKQIEFFKTRAFQINNRNDKVNQNIVLVCGIYLQF